MPGLRRAHIEPRWKTGKQAADYCKKDGYYYEWGTLRNSINGPLARKHAYEQFYKKVLEGYTDLQLIEYDAQLFNACFRQVDRLRLQKRPEPSVPKREIILYYGDTGTGKTRAAFDFPDAYEVNFDEGQQTWYDGYCQQETAIFDEFSGQMRLSLAKKVFDNHYVRMRSVKGSHVWFNPKRIVLTSNHHPSTWWNWSRHLPIDQEAFRRRFTAIYVFEQTPLGPIRKHVDIDTFWPIAKPNLPALPPVPYAGSSRSGLFGSPPPTMRHELLAGSHADEPTLQGFIGFPDDQLQSDGYSSIELLSTDDL